MSTPSNKVYRLTCAFLALTTLGLAKSAIADSVPDRTVELGKLECKVLPESRKNYVLRSTAQVNCIFKPMKGQTEEYQGETGIKLGVDLSIRENDTLRFAVVSSHEVDEQRPAFALKGRYFGPSATAAVTYGAGVSALVGGSKGEISLQPIGVETLRGLGISAGLGYLNLEPADVS